MECRLPDHSVIVKVQSGKQTPLAYLKPGDYAVLVNHSLLYAVPLLCKARVYQGSLLHVDSQNELWVIAVVPGSVADRTENPFNGHLGHIGSYHMDRESECKYQNHHYHRTLDILMKFKEPKSATSWGLGTHLLYTVPAKTSKGHHFDKLIAMFSLKLSIDHEGKPTPNSKLLWVHKGYATQ